jgi:aminopeptidase
MNSYASLLTGACLGIKDGARLRIVCEPPHREMARLAAVAAWERGAAEVVVAYSDSLLSRAAVDKTGERWLDLPSDFLNAESERLATGGWSYLRLLGDEDPDVWNGVDSGRLQRLNKARSIAALPFQKAARSNAIAWCVAPVPTRAWAHNVYKLSGGQIPSDPEAALWNELLPVLRLDAADPEKKWLADLRLLEARALAMNAKPFASLRFRGPGTDLTIGLSPESRWVGGGGRTLKGDYFAANIPTEEVYTTPDNRLAEGRVAATKPVKVLGATIEKAWFRFEGGKVVESGAERNAEVLARYLDIDAGAKRLGEVAIVEADNPVGRSGLVFDNGLLDENAACHIALGSGYEEAFPAAHKLDEIGRAAAGFNDSLVHTDFMIGSREVDVDAVDARGVATPLLRGGRFVYDSESRRSVEHSGQVPVK